MKILLLSHLADSISNQIFLDFISTYKDKGIEVQALHVNPSKHHLLLNTSDQSFSKDVDLVFIRMGSSAPVGLLEYIRYFEQKGIPCMNSLKSIILCRDKSSTYLTLANKGVKIPRSILASSQSYDSNHIEKELGGYPFVIKIPISTKGDGVFLITSQEKLSETVNGFKTQTSVFIAQKFIEESRGRDFRALVMNGEFLGAVQRTGKPGEFRSNIDLGGSARFVEVSDEVKELAILASKALGAYFTGVDILESHDSYVVCEVNCSPGLQAFDNFPDETVDIFMKNIFQFAKYKN